MTPENNAESGPKLFSKRVRKMVRLAAIEFGALTGVIVYFEVRSLIGAIGAGIGATIIAFIASALIADHHPGQPQGWVSRHPVAIALLIGFSGSITVYALRESGGVTLFLATVVGIVFFAGTLTIIDIWNEDRR